MNYYRLQSFFTLRLVRCAVTQVPSLRYGMTNQRVDAGSHKSKPEIRNSKPEIHLRIE
jgi:hypothetical protein